MRYLVAATLRRNNLAGETRWELALVARTSEWAIDWRKCASPCHRLRRGRVARPDDESVIDRPNCDCLFRERVGDEGRRPAAFDAEDDVRSGTHRLKNTRVAALSQTGYGIQRDDGNDTGLLSNCQRWLDKPPEKSIVVICWRSYITGNAVLGLNDNDTPRVCWPRLENHMRVWRIEHFKNFNSFLELSTSACWQW